MEFPEIDPSVITKEFDAKKGFTRKNADTKAMLRITQSFSIDEILAKFGTLFVSKSGERLQLTAAEDRYYLFAKDHMFDALDVGRDFTPVVSESKIIRDAQGKTFGYIDTQVGLCYAIDDEVPLLYEGFKLAVNKPFKQIQTVFNRHTGPRDKGFICEAPVRIKYVRLADHRAFTSSHMVGRFGSRQYDISPYIQVQSLLRSRYAQSPVERQEPKTYSTTSAPKVSRIG